MPRDFVEDLKDAIRARWEIGEPFSIEEVYALADDLADLHPDVEGIVYRIRQHFNHLRDMERCVVWHHDPAATLMMYRRVGE
jgi:hypothetical protein